MQHLKARFIEILRIELGDLRDDIDQLIAECTKDHDSGDFSDHLYLENLAVLRNEILGVGVFESILTGVDPEEFEDLDAMITAVRKAFSAEVEKCGLVKAVQLSIDRKIAKVAKYVAV